MVVSAMPWSRRDCTFLDAHQGLGNLVHMRRAREAAAASRTVESLLQRAIAARSAASRERYARLGLASRAPLDREIQSMLLRQLYLAYFEQHRFDRALEVAEQMLALRVLPDVCHHDAARAMAALSDTQGAEGHLRLAARTAPARRRAFHLWTLGSMLFLAGRHDLAEAALVRAIRWSSTDRPLYVGHLALVRLARKGRVDDLEEMIARLTESPCGQGYGRFVLGMLCSYAGHRANAKRYLQNFLSRTRAGPAALAIALAGELALAEERLRELDVN